MEELGMLPKVTTPAEIFIPFFDSARLHDYLRVAATLRSADFGVEVFPEPKKLGQQLKYADRRGFKVALVAGENEFAAGTIQIKNLATTTSETVPLNPAATELVAALKLLLGK
jgi:histidyl-tRNA synthetase